MYFGVENTLFINLTSLFLIADRQRKNKEAKLFFHHHPEVAVDDGFTLSTNTLAPPVKRGRLYLPEKIRFAQQTELSAAFSLS